ncbi:MAG TPA: 50S ribosomal protein L4 [Candidatus Pacearchaeota archaeon]|nr:50S ribosomal protein L4 [Candidatus Pacearchaeota archaeon]HOK94040.1 50S ribosomal protein L4 [Candidatus Pacearchaeota archaeon]HPO75111.1 50S ribosomal protein L4 [Candidatus Pacearchaeota archaeon]
MQSALYNQKGEKVGEIDLSEDVFNRKPSKAARDEAKPQRALNSDHIYQTVLYYQNLRRKPIAKTKDRSEVSGGGRKPWRQKGTGRARHGSIRSPLWRGGGVTFGPKPEKNYQTKLSKEAKKKALYMVLSQKIKDNEIIFLDKIEMEKLKTSLAAEIIKNLEKIAPEINKKKTLIVLSKANEQIKKSFRNLENVKVISVNSLNPYLLLQNKYIIMEHEAVSQICTNR